MAEKLASLPVSSSSARSFARMMLSGAMEVEIDKQGRALIPSYLREYAGIKGEMVLAGVYSRVEIWSKSAWNSYAKASEANASDNAEKLGDWAI